MEQHSSLVFFVNGKKTEIDNPNPETTLLQYLRQTLYLTGTKSSCGQGACGACTVMVSSYDVIRKSIRHVSVNACLVPLCYLHGRAVTTVEGVGSSRTGLHAVQKSLVESHGFQCGFCTPGMVMTMYTLFRNNPHPTQEQMERVLEGNLCRCTGYRPIVDAFTSAKKNCPCGLGLCQQKSEDAEPSKAVRHDPMSQDVIFPPELQLTESYHTASVMFRGGRYTWYRPTTLQQILQLKKKFPTAPVVMGCNSLGYILRKGQLVSEVIICGTNVEELSVVKSTTTGISVGAGVTLGSLEECLKDIAEKTESPGNRSVVAALSVLRWLGVDQIRNTATIGGHVMSHAPNLDMQVFLMAAGAELQFTSLGKGQRLCKMDNDFFLSGHGQTAGDEILTSIYIPYTTQNEYILGIKQPQRRGFDYGIVTCGMYVELDDDVVRSMRLSFGGVDSKPALAQSTAETAVGKVWSEDLVSDVCSALVMELKNNHYDNSRFRLTLACSFFYKFFLYIQAQLNNADLAGSIADIAGLPYTPVIGTQVYDVPAEDGNRIVWKPIPNVTSEYVTSGEAQFVDDIPSFQSELHAIIVTSKRAHARILSVDVSKALAVKGVVDYIDRTDVPFHNRYGIVVPDDTLFAEDEVSCYGQSIGAILAESPDVGVKAAELVDIEYEDMDAIFTIEEAIEKNSLFEEVHRVNVGDIDGARETADMCLEGECVTGMQEHMYMETQAALAVPKREQQEMEVFASSQALNEAQTIIAEFLGISRNRVTLKARRVGGAFGGKAANAVQTAGVAAVAAWKTHRPVRCVYDRPTDVALTGKRHPSKTTYKVYFNEDGCILGLDLNLYLNAGYTHDVSSVVVQVAMWAMNGCYNIRNIRGQGYICKTNTPSNTALRGFGVPQMLVAIETVIEHVSTHLKMPADQVRQINLIRTGGLTASNQIIPDDNMYRCWAECRTDSQYDLRRGDMADFNSTNRWSKRGISLIPIMFPVGYPTLSSNQAGALVLVYLDGSVLLTHGGVEIGQGLHTKMIQVAATELDIPNDNIIISEVSTATIPNAPETGGTQVADLNAGAIKDACIKIRRRLEPFRHAKPDGTWEEWVNSAYEARVSLAATGFFKSMEQGFDFATNSGIHANYYTYGTVCTEVEIDCLTGEHQVRRVDIVMDVGRSLNPAIDVGQIEGGFVMGYGMMTMEQIVLSHDGRMKTSGPLDYKIPCVRNIPREFKVKLLQNSGDVKTVYSSKGVGEPPLLLASSVFFAIKEAIMAARKEVNLTEDYPLKCPATTERIRMACQDNLVQTCLATEIDACKTPTVIL